MIESYNKSTRWKKFMADSKDFGALLGAILLGVVGGIVAAAILDALTPPKCPYCGSTVCQGDPVCGSCGQALYWGRA